MNEYISYLHQLPAPLAMVIAVVAFAAQLDFRTARQERRRRTRPPAKASRELSS